jgi:UDP-N-acetylmuramyl-tripeptide synthetase
VWTCSAEARPAARLQAHGLRYTPQGLAFDVREGAEVQPLATRLIGDFNVANLLGVIGALRALGIPLKNAVGVCADLSPVPGRMQRVPGPVAAPAVVVDYAHTPDALEKALLALQPLAGARGGQLWCVFGCGGNRDASKRAPMGRIAQRLAHRVVLTSDNPRMESPAGILNQVVTGMDLLSSAHRAEVIEARHDAIAHAVSQCANGDVILIAGKGHEDYQDIGGHKLPFSDVNEAAAALARRQGVLS